MTQRRIGFLAFDGVQALDFVGPADAFASDAFKLLAKNPDNAITPSPYEVVIIGRKGKPQRLLQPDQIRWDACCCCRQFGERG